MLLSPRFTRSQISDTDRYSSRRGSQRQGQPFFRLRKTLSLQGARWAMLSTLSASVSTYFSKSTSTAPFATPEDEASSQGERENAHMTAPRTFSRPAGPGPLTCDSPMLTDPL